MVVNHRGRASAPCITKWICTALGLANLLGSFAQAAMASGCETPNISGKSEINRPKVMCRWALGPSKLTLGHQLWTVSTVDFDGQIWVPGLVNVDSEAWMIIVLSMVVPLKILSILTFQYWWLLLLNKHVYAVLLIFFSIPMVSNQFLLGWSSRMTQAKPCLPAWLLNRQGTRWKVWSEQLGSLARVLRQTKDDTILVCIIYIYI